MLSCGIVGLPNVGKSTLFNALLKKRVALSANYPFATVEPNTGVVAVPDYRLEVLSELVKREEGIKKAPPIVPAVVEFVDIAGLVKGSHKGEGLGNQFLSHIREVDAIIHVLRDFEDENVVRAGAQNPDADLLTVETELALSDLQVLEKLIENVKKEAKGDPKLRSSEKMVQILEGIKKSLEEGKIVGNYQVGDKQLEKWFRSLPLLSTKPVLFVHNVSESEYADRVKQSVTASEAKLASPAVGQSQEIASGSLNPRNDGSTLVISARLEEELVDLTEPDRLDYLKQLGIKETSLERLIKAAYQLLGLISFLTAGKKEVRAWTIKQGTKAPQAAGVIHTDFEKGFIRAQVIEYEKLIEAGSYAVAKQKGWIRTEGKDYIVLDGDVVEFMISS